MDMKFLLLMTLLRSILRTGCGQLCCLFQGAELRGMRYSLL